jgi:hypothetical protein
VYNFPPESGLPTLSSACPATPKTGERLTDI